MKVKMLQVFKGKHVKFGKNENIDIFDLILYIELSYHSNLLGEMFFPIEKEEIILLKVNKIIHLSKLI